MPESAVASTVAGVEATYKSRDVEGFLDVHFYRKVGFVLARFFARLGITPTTVTFLGAAVGIVAGHLYYYRNLSINIAGMALHVFANALDNADGQLARITQQDSRAGRTLDGLCDAIVFASVYVHLSLRYIAEGGSAWIGLLALAAAFSHSLQSAAADYYRHGYLFFVHGTSRTELDSSDAVRKVSDQLSWRREPWKKFLARFYFNYTREQEILAPQQAKLLATINVRAGAIPAWFAEEYRQCNRQMTKWFNVLTVNTRMLILFVFLLLGRPTWYFFVDLTLLNLVLAFVLVRQNHMSREMRVELESRS
jgi:phosphatidylglycerophosphate synthase